MIFRISNIDAASAAALAAFLTAHMGQPVTVIVSSEGGSVTDGLQMANAIRAHGQVTAVADGIAASAATLPLMAAATVQANIGTLLMFHRPSTAAAGQAADMNAAAEALTAAATLMQEIYTARGLTAAQVAELMGEADKWMTAAQALAAKLIDSVLTTPVSAEGSLAIAARLGSGISRPEVEAMFRDGIQSGAPLSIGSGLQTRFVPQRPSKATAAAQGILIRAGMVENDPANPYRGTRLLDMEAEFARPMASGVYADGIDAFPNVLSEAANRALGLAFDEVAEPYRLICAPLPVPDFRQVSLASLGAISTPEEDIGEFGELEFGHRKDAGEQTGLATTGMRFGLSRRALVNDDLMVFSETPRALATAVARRIGDSLAAIVTTGNNGAALTDGTAIFAGARNNTGNAALSSASLDAARSKMALRKDPTGIPAGHRMAWLWVPEALVGTARTIITSEYSVKNPQGDSQSTAPNEARNLVTADAVIGDYRLDEADAPKWHAIARGAFRRLHLRDHDAPMIDDRSLDNRDGFAWRVIHDYRVVAVGASGVYRGGA